MSSLKIRFLEDNDIPLMKIWLNKDYVIKWYENPDEWLAEINGRFDEFRFIRHFIAVYDDKPIGFCQYYTCLDADEDWYGDIPLIGSYSIDYLIGEKEFLKRGFGKAIVDLITEKVFSLKDSQRIIVLPDAKNDASCRTLLASGYIYDQKNKLYLKTK